MLAMLAMLGANQTCAQTAPVAQPFGAPLVNGTAPELAKRIFLPPPAQWDKEMLVSHSALSQTAADFANLTDGLAFGMSPAQANARLPDPYPGLTWASLSMANEYPGEARYFGVPMGAAGKLRMQATACAGAGSHIIFLFSPQGLFRVSYRLLVDKNCVDANDAAREIFSQYVPLGKTVALSVRYRTGKTQVVDVTDPAAGYLIPNRWRGGTQ